MRAVDCCLALLLIVALEVTGNTDQKVRDGANYFAFRLFKQLSSKSEGNLVVSPWSLTTTLLMLREGAKGASARELQTSLALPENIQDTRNGYTKIVNSMRNNNSNNTLDIANAMFPDHRFSPLEEFSMVIRRVYGASVETIDFQKAQEAAARINRWAEINTRGLIKEVVTEDMFSPATSLVLANAVFFKGIWNYPFNSSLTTQERFYPNGYNGSPINVQMMHQRENFLFGDIRKMGCQALLLPYHNDKFYMVLLLPFTNTHVDDVISKMQPVQSILDEMYSIDVDVSLPRFRIESSLSLNEPLKELGIVDVFSNRANLSGIGKGPLRVSDVIQKAVIKVNEEGTKAAAVTAFVVELISGGEPARFTADRPFVSLIVEQETNIVLFATRISNPQYSSYS